MSINLLEIERLNAIINLPNLGSLNLRSIKACISGAAGLPMDVQDRFQ
jgi:hypothetical protein